LQKKTTLLSHEINFLFSNQFPILFIFCHFVGLCLYL
jgi:hypothetical protein